MALRIKKLSAPYGVTYDDVYFKIDSVSYEDSRKKVCFQGLAYVSQEAKEAGCRNIPDLMLCDEFDIEDKNANYIEACYLYIKEQAKLLEGRSPESIEVHNKEILNECMSLNIPPTGLLNADYLNFVDAEDC